MKYIALILLLAGTAMAGNAQTPAKPATQAAKPATAVAAKTATSAKPAATATAKPAVGADKLPPGIPPVKALKKTLFTVSLRYQDIKIGTGAVAESNKLYKVFYTGWVASDGHKFDSTDDHPRAPVQDKDGKPVLGDDGKPKQGPVQPITFPQGYGRVIPGWDQAFDGMKIGGKRRIFIPWRLAYGEKGRPGPDAAHPGIPAKADLIFDIELVDVSDMPSQPTRPGMNGARPMGGHPMIPGAAPATTPGAPAAGPSHGMGGALTPAPTATPAAPATPNASPAPAPAPAVPAATPAPAPAAPATK